MLSTPSMTVESIYMDLPNGDICVQRHDRKQFDQLKCSLLYGEVDSSNIATLMKETYLNINGADRLLDLGMGRGKLAMEVFLSQPHLVQVIGVELCESRFKVAVAALKKLAESDLQRFHLVSDKEGKQYILQEKEKKRSLVFEHKSIFDASSWIPHCQVIQLNVEVRVERCKEVDELFSLMKVGTRVTTYNAMAMSSVKHRFRMLGDVSYLKVHQKKEDAEEVEPACNNNGGVVVSP